MDGQLNEPIANGPEVEYSDLHTYPVPKARKVASDCIWGLYLVSLLAYHAVAMPTIKTA